MKFGVREICDVTFKATTTGQKLGTKSFKKYQPMFKIDTATTSEMSQESTTVYAQGGRGYNRLIAWEGEKTMTFTVTDALMSPIGLAVLSGAGLINAGESKLLHVHTLFDGMVGTDKQVTIDYDTLADELGIVATTDSDGKLTYPSINICTDIDVYGTKLDGSGAGIGWFDDLAFVETATKGLITVAKDGSAHVKSESWAAGDSVELDFYVALSSGATEVVIEPDSFGGYFYVEADTLFRREDTGKDMAAVLTFPRVKVQSGFTFTMAASGDPSTFDFTMDAFPGYTQFDRTKKVCVTMDIVGDDGTSADETVHTNYDVDTHKGADEDAEAEG